FRITEIEVWVTNTRNATENVQDIIALSDLGEPQRFNNPDNPRFPVPMPARHLDIFGRQALPGRVEGDDTTYVRGDYANDLLFEIQNYPERQIYQADKAVRILQSEFNLVPGRDFKKVSARKLNPNSEYTVNNDLGIISLNVNLQPNDVLGVAFRYQYNQKNYQVGELSDGVYDPENVPVRFVKMLKTSAQRVDLPLWDLMMKNVYSVGAFQVNPEDFLLDIFYEDPGNGFKRFLPESNIAGEPLLRVFKMDRINVQGDPCPDGIFDFIPGITINPRNGRVMFPVLEPFGDDLVERIDDPDLKEKFNFRQLYDSTRIIAQQYPELNRFSIRGSYKSSISSEISLGAFNLPEGSVRVTGGGRPLVEGVDYEVDYNIGRVRILDESLINSGNPVNVSFEDNTLFGFQQKTMLGLRADYKLNDNIEFGATYLHLFERPFTQKVNIGDDPISNRVFGVDVNYSKEAPWLTKLVDALPLIDTKEESNVTFSAEAAYLKPGHSNAIERLDSRRGRRNKGGTVYIDDFEGTTSGYDLRNAVTNWVLASVPQNDERNSNPMFPESQFIDSTITGVNRARLSWYRIDDFVRMGGGEDQLYPYVAQIQQNEIFRTRAQALNVTTSIIPTFDLTFYPNERGPYNFDWPEGTQESAGLEQNGTLKDPETRWGGIMRGLPNTNFEAANIEFIDFWMLNPFIESDNPGDLYFNLGNISEDILRDSRRFFENGLPTDDDNSTTDETNWGRIPRVQAIINAFNNDETSRNQQDLGLDGLDNDDELQVFAEEIERYQSLDPGAFQAIQEDPSNDDFVFFNSPDDFPEAPNIGQDVLDRYKRNNNPQGNSAVSSGNQVNASTNLPDTEDLNRDNSLNEEEEYFQYHVPLRSVTGANGLELAIDPNLVIDTLHQDAPGGGPQRIWYHFKIPIDQFDSRVGGIRDFRAIQFIRMYLKNFRDQVTLRFATLELTRNQWRRYLRPLTGVGRPGVISSTPVTRFEVNAVGLDENSSRVPVNYVRPPGLRPEQLNSTNFAANAFQNERSLSLLVEDLGVDTMKGVFKTLDLDMRFFDSLEMFIHAERIPELDFDVEDEDVSVFIRLGSDFENNFYEYEIPLTFTDLEVISGLDVSRPDELEEYAEEVWRQENYMRFLLKDFITLKKNRNEQDFPLNQIYEEVVDESQPDRVYRIKGNPNLGLVKVMMVGVVNRDYEKKSNHSFEVWLNELRVNGLDERGGAAAIARLDMQLADFGNFTVAANYSTRGWGGIEQKLAERSREEIFQYDASINLELGKLLPEAAGLVLPMYASISETYSTPQFDPYDLDIPLKEKLQATSSRADRDSIRRQAQDYSSIKSLNFTNVRKARSGNNRSAPLPWDISNFKLTYAYTDMNRRNPIIESDRTKTYKGAVDYNYSMTPLYISPFKKLIKKDKYLKLISELNFNLIPNSFSVNNELNRELQVTKYRFTELEEQFSTFYNKRFTWDRNYTLNWDLTKSLKFNFGANNRAIIDELKDYDTETATFRTRSQLREEIWGNLQNFGRTKNYTHNFGANYTVPFKKIPFLEWVSVKANYGGTYTWAGS
ncbi:MAG: cell surface protein SprA, partial [Bacteroidota bacterium]